MSDTTQVSTTLTKNQKNRLRLKAKKELEKTKISQCEVIKDSDNSNNSLEDVQSTTNALVSEKSSLISKLSIPEQLDKLRIAVKSYAKENPMFKKLEDNSKVELFSNKKKYKNLYTSHKDLFEAVILERAKYTNKKEIYELFNSWTNSDTKSTTPSTVTSEEKTIDEIIKIVNNMWETVKEYYKKYPDDKSKSDKEKLEIFRGPLGFAKIMEEYPIVTRYMICFGQYKSAALRRVLEKTRMMKHPLPAEREKGYMEDQWVRRQADYVQYLWESYQKGHYNNAERDWVYQETYKRLRGEFDDFRNMHKDIEKKVAEEKKSLAGKNVRDLLIRLKSGAQTLSPEDEEILRYELKCLLVKSAFDKVLKELKSIVPISPPTCTGDGHGPDDKQPKVTMIETVDVNRMNEIDDKYKSKEYQGMEPVPEDEEDSNEIVEEYEEEVVE